MAACHLGAPDPDAPAPSAGRSGSPAHPLLPFVLIQGPPGTGKTHTVKVRWHAAAACWQLLSVQALLLPGRRCLCPTSNSRACKLQPTACSNRRACLACGIWWPISLCYAGLIAALFEIPDTQTPAGHAQRVAPGSLPALLRRTHCCHGAGAPAAAAAAGDAGGRRGGVQHAFGPRARGGSGGCCTGGSGVLVAAVAVVAGTHAVAANGLSALSVLRGLVATRALYCCRPSRVFWSAPPPTPPATSCSPA